MKFKLVESIDDKLIEGKLTLKQELRILEVVDRVYESQRRSKAKIKLPSSKLRTLAQENGLGADCKINEFNYSC